MVRRHDDAASLEVALIENMAREDLNPVEEARACAALVEELGLTREEVGLRVGRSRVAVSNLIRLLDLPDEALELIERGDLTEGHGRALLLAADHAARRTPGPRRGRAPLVGARARVPRPRPPAEQAAGGRARRTRRAPPRPGRPAIEQIADALGAALGRDVDVAPAKGTGYRVQLSFESLDDALDVARRLRVRAVSRSPATCDRRRCRPRRAARG